MSIVKRLSHKSHIQHTMASTKLSHPMKVCVVGGDDTKDTNTYQHSPPEPTILESSFPSSNGNNDDDSIPQSFLCPLTLEAMADPVLDSEGNTFERKALLKWLQKSNQSPVSRQNLNDSVLVPNIALRDLIHDAMGEQWLVRRRAELDVQFGLSHPENARLSIHSSKYRKMVDCHLEKMSQDFGTTVQLNANGICAFMAGGDHLVLIEVPETLGHFFIYSSKYVPSLSEDTKDRILELNYMPTATRKFSVRLVSNLDFR
jgi:hypothetical protein